MNKKIIIICVFVLVLGMAGTVNGDNVLNNDYAEDTYKLSIDRLIAIGIFKGYEDGSFKPENNITRGEFAKVITILSGYSNITPKDGGISTYKDVDITHWAEPYVDMATRLGIINGYGNGIFGVDDKIKYNQVLTMIVRLLGYEEVALKNGGYPDGYCILAKEIGLLKEIEVDLNQYANRSGASKIIDNALRIPLMRRKDNIFSYKNSIDEGHYLINDKLGLEEIEGQIVGEVNYKDVVGVRIDEDIKSYKVVGGINQLNSFGKMITAWVKDDKIVYCEFDNKDIKIVYGEFVIGMNKHITRVDDDKEYDILASAVAMENLKVKEEGALAFENNAYGYIVLNNKGGVIAVNTITNATKGTDAFEAHKGGSIIIYDMGFNRCKELLVKDSNVQNSIAISDKLIIFKK